MWESYCINAPAPGQEHDLAASAQAVDSEKHLVPRQVGTLTHDLFKVTGLNFMYDVDHLIFCGDLLRHVPPVEERNELLRRGRCMVGATGWCRRTVQEEVR